jgi:hypothetical protein
MGCLAVGILPDPERVSASWIANIERARGAPSDRVVLTERDGPTGEVVGDDGAGEPGGVGQCAQRRCVRLRCGRRAVSRLGKFRSDLPTQLTTQHATGHLRSVRMTNVIRTVGSAVASRERPLRSISFSDPHPDGGSEGFQIGNASTRNGVARGGRVVMRPSLRAPRDAIARRLSRSGSPRFEGGNGGR